jgi:hypothetical protein
MALDELPDILTLPEAAAVLRIGRTAAYEQARRWLDTGGRDGIPVIRVGRQFRVLRSSLVQMLGGSAGAS